MKKEKIHRQFRNFLEQAQKDILQAIPNIYPVESPIYKQIKTKGIER